LTSLSGATYFFYYLCTTKHKNEQSDTYPFNELVAPMANAHRSVNPVCNNQ